MALPPSYGGSLAPQAAAANRPDPAAYGVGLAEDVGKLGGAAFDAGMRADQVKQQVDENTHRIALIEDQRNLSATIADRAAAMATGQADLKQQLIQLRETAPEGGAGHEAAAGELIDKWRDDFLGTLTDPRVRTALIDNVAAAEGNLKVGEAEFAAVKREEKIGDDFGTLKTTLSSSIFSSDPADLPHALGQADDLWEKAVAAAPLDGNGRAKLSREGRHDIHFAAAQRIGLDHPQALIAMIDKGMLNDVALNDHEIPALRNWAQALQDHQEVEARRAVSEARADARTFLSSIPQRVANGVPVPPEDFVRAHTLLANPDLKLAAEGFDIGKAEVIDRVNRKWDGASADVIDGRIKQLNAEIERKGDKVDPAEVIERNRLQEMLPSRTAEQRNDPLGHYARQGGAIEPINWTDANSLQNRLNQARIAQGRNGGPLVVLSDEEAAPIAQAVAQGGVKGHVEAMDMLAAAPPEFAIAAARQVAPGNPHFWMATALATLGREGRAAARDSLLGSDAIAAHKSIVREKEAQAQFGRFAGAMTGLDPQTQHGLYDAALGIFATRRLRSGRVEWAENDPEAQAAFRLAVNVAVGAARRPDGSVQGGFGNWAGGTTILPHDMTQGEFETALGRAGPDDFRRAAGGHEPHFASGKAPSLGQFKQMQLVPVGDGRYRAQLGNAALIDETGRAYEFDIRKLGAGR
jgi:hypothetical protein